MNRPTVFLAAIAWLATVALAFMIGRASTTPIVPPIATASAPVRSASATQVPVPLASITPTPTPSPTPAYPRYQSTIPAAFRGSWDEIISDRCEGREARYILAATTFNEFEVHSDVSKVKLVSPTDIEISVTGYDDDKSQYNGVYQFTLADGGKTLTGRKRGSTFFHRCPAG